jgi:putative FmdB family regulatory protein
VGRLLRLPLAPPGRCRVILLEMPLYEYRCSDCGRRFEEFVMGEPAIACPDCASESVQKLLSVFAVAAGSSSRASESEPVGCGSCGDPRGPGACRMN